MEQYLKQGLISDSKILDIRQVDVRFHTSPDHTYTNIMYSVGLRRQDTRKQYPCFRYNVCYTRDALIP